MANFPFSSFSKVRFYAQFFMKLINVNDITCRMFCSKFSRNRLLYIWILGYNLSTPFRSPRLSLSQISPTHTCSVMFCEELLHLISWKSTKRLASATELQTERPTAPQCKSYFVSQKHVKTPNKLIIISHISPEHLLDQTFLHKC
jgi:hypothetical protein